MHPPDQPLNRSTDQLVDRHHTFHGPERGGPLPPEVAAKVLEALGITEEHVEHLRATARLVGGDWGLRVELGPPGGGSFFSEEECRIQLDPLHLSEFVVAHEGGHRAITRGPHALGMKAEVARDLYGKIGFAFGKNACEDPADNDWWSEKYEGLRELPREWYRDFAASDQAMSVAEAERTMGIPAIRQMITELGRVPRFVHFGNELQRLWCRGEIAASGLPDDVRQALEHVRDAAHEYFADVPSAHPTESEVVARARSRFQTFHDRIWPELGKLIEEDLKDERLRQMVEEGGGVGGAPAKARGAEAGGGEGSPLDDLPEDLKREIQEKLREAAERDAAATEVAGEAEAAEAERDVEALRAALPKLQQVAGDESKSEGEREQARQGIAGMEEALESLQGKARGARERAAQRAKDLRDGTVPQPVPLDQLSDALRQALEKAYAKLPADVRAKLEEQARRALEALEDELNEHLEGELVPDKPESHAERHEREEREETERREHERRTQEEAKAREEITRAIERDKTPYDRAYEAAAPLIDRLTDDLERLFQKQRHPRWRPGFPTGGRLDLRKAMQVEADPSRYDDLWERKTIPEKHDRTFTLLVDLSGSMKGEKIQETFKAAIVIAESLARVGIEVEILGFQDELIEFKRADEPMSDAVRSRMSGMLAEVLNQNPGGRNRADWNDDGYCLDRAAARIRERPQKERFLIPLSDGLPVPSPAHAGPEWELSGMVARIRQAGGVKLVGVGIGPGTEHVRRYYPNSVVESTVSRFPESIATLLEDMIINPDSYS